LASASYIWPRLTTEYIGGVAAAYIFSGLTSLVTSVECNLVSTPSECD